jgi:hypothetical protein
MNKKIILLALVGLLVVAGAAFAHWGGPAPWMYQDGRFGGCRGGGPGPRMYQDGQFGGGGLRGGAMYGENVRGMGAGPQYLNNYPEDILKKMNDLRRTNLELRLALIDEKPDEGEVRSLFEKAEQLRKEIHTWRFEQFMKNRMQDNL